MQKVLVPRGVSAEMEALPGKYICQQLHGYPDKRRISRYRKSKPSSTSSESEQSANSSDTLKTGSSPSISDVNTSDLLTLVSSISDSERSTLHFTTTSDYAHPKSLKDKVSPGWKDQLPDSEWHCTLPSIAEETSVSLTNPSESTRKANPVSSGHNAEAETKTSKWSRAIHKVRSMLGFREKNDRSSCPLTEGSRSGNEALKSDLFSSASDESCGPSPSWPTVTSCSSEESDGIIHRPHDDVNDFRQSFFHPKILRNGSDTISASSASTNQSQPNSKLFHDIKSGHNVTQKNESRAGNRKIAIKSGKSFGDEAVYRNAAGSGGAKPEGERQKLSIDIGGDGHEHHSRPVYSPVDSGERLNEARRFLAIQFHHFHRERNNCGTCGVAYGNGATNIPFLELLSRPHKLVSHPDLRHLYQGEFPYGSHRTFQELPKRKLYVYRKGFDTGTFGYSDSQPESDNPFKHYLQSEPRGMACYGSYRDTEKYDE